MGVVVVVVGVIVVGVALEGSVGVEEGLGSGVALGWEEDSCVGDWAGWAAPICCSAETSFKRTEFRCRRAATRPWSCGDSLLVWGVEGWERASDVGVD